MEAAPFALASSLSLGSLSEKSQYDLSIGEPQRLAFPGNLMHRAVFQPRVNHYGSSLGDRDLRAQIRQLYYSDHAHKDYELLMTHGAIHALDLILRAHIKEGDEVLIPDPCFPPYHVLTQFAGGQTRSYPLKRSSHGFQLETAAIAERIHEKTRLVILNTPHNPTGALLTEKVRDELAELFRCHPQVLYISDEVYSHIIYGQAEHVSLLDASDQGFIVNSLSKSHALQGLRIGWVMAPRQLLTPVHELLQNAVGCVSSLGQEVAKELLGSDYMAAADYSRARNLAMRVLEAHGIPFFEPQGTFFILIPVKDDRAAARDLAQDGVRVVPGSSFGSQGQGYIRACFAQTDDEIIGAFEQLAISLQKKGWVRS